MALSWAPLGCVRRSIPISPTRSPLTRSSYPPNTIYSFDTWGEQLRDFITQRVGEPATLVCNSVGGELGVSAPHGM